MTQMNTEQGMPRVDKVWGQVIGGLDLAEKQEMLTRLKSYLSTLQQCAIDLASDAVVKAVMTHSVTVEEIVEQVHEKIGELLAAETHDEAENEPEDEEVS